MTLLQRSLNSLLQLHQVLRFSAGGNRKSKSRSSKDFLAKMRPAPKTGRHISLIHARSSLLHDLVKTVLSAYKQQNQMRPDSTFYSLKGASHSTYHGIFNVCGVWGCNSWRDVLSQIEAIEHDLQCFLINVTTLQLRRS